MKSLARKIALVTGASRGVGKGVCQALGEAGAMVYLTGRSESPETATVPLPGSIHETAALVNQAGGVGIAIRCDHADDAQVREVFERIQAEQGRLDILVNNAWQGYQTKQRSKKSGFHTLFWKLPPAFWDSMFQVGVRSHYVSSIYGAALMAAQLDGLIVHISSTAGRGYSDNVAYGVSKAAVDRMAADMAQELRLYNITVVSLWPGFVSTEMLMANRKDQRLQPWMESPVFVGRAIAALAADADRMKKSGQVLLTRQLAAEYGFSDLGGHQPSLEKGT